MTLRHRIAATLAPAIDERAPYARLMIDKLVEIAEAHAANGGEPAGSSGRSSEDRLLPLEMAELARQLNRRLDEMFEGFAERRVSAEAAIRNLLWDNKVGILRALQSLTSGDRRQNEHSLPSHPRQTQGCCIDCGRKYGDQFGFPDLVVPNAVWAKISPTGHEGGLLCPSCMCRRAYDAGLENVPAVFRSGPFAVLEER